MTTSCRYDPLREPSDCDCTDTCKAMLEAGYSEAEANLADRYKKMLIAAGVEPGTPEYEWAIKNFEEQR